MAAENKAKKLGAGLYSYRGYFIQKMRKGWRVYPVGKPEYAEPSRTLRDAMEDLDNYMGCPV